jgi:hypothetical protein
MGGERERKVKGIGSTRSYMKQARSYSCSYTTIPAYFRSFSVYCLLLSFPPPTLLYWMKVHCIYTEMIVRTVPFVQSSSSDCLIDRWKYISPISSIHKQLLSITLTDGYIVPRYVWYEIQIGNE